MISGKTTLIAHLGYPTEAFKAPMIYNPWFEQHGSTPSSCRWASSPRTTRDVLPALFTLTNIRGALVTMPHKVTTLGLVDEADADGARRRRRQRAAEARRRHAGSATSSTAPGFVRGVERKGRRSPGSSALVAGSGGVGSAIAASLAAAGVGRDRPLRRPRRASAEALARAPARALPRARGPTGSQGPGRPRHRRQRHAARHEGRRPAALRRRPRRRRARSSARS